MQVEVDVKCMQNNFGGRGFSGFGDFALFCFPSKFGQKLEKFTFNISLVITTGLGGGCGLGVASDTGGG